MIQPLGCLRMRGMRKSPVFSELEATGRFHRDSRLGRLFHPGTVSYRELSPNDSVHIAVTPENRVSVHVDRVSPLSTRAGDRSRYSLLRILRHNVAHGVDSSVRLWRRKPGDHRCELDCEIVAVEGERSEAPVMYEFSCRAAGAQGCRWKTRTTSEEELVARVTEHARTAHGVSSFSGTLANYARAVARQQGDKAHGEASASPSC